MNGNSRYNDGKRLHNNSQIIVEPLILDSNVVKT